MLRMAQGGEMTPFTDEDLKRVKYDRFGFLESWGTDDQLAALLARLKAADDIALGVDAAHPEDENCGCSMCDLLKAWRKAAGK